MSLPENEWDAYLDRHCSDPLTRREVKALLLADAQVQDRLEGMVANGLQSLVETSEEARIGTRIGPYLVLRLLGRGGVSSVFLVRRDDEQFQKKLALKLVRRGMDTADILNRFRSERQILANLDHPNIARFFDGGTTNDGLPYFVMEHIEGKPITQYCDEKQLNLKQRLGLVRKVCAAVQIAHRNLIVHRDLKPSNILVTAEGVPKLLDFGIAKLLNPEWSAGTIIATSHTAKLMTPGYASPEQVRGGPITTASDIYALGVLFYELLTGQRPYRNAADWFTLERQILDETPKPPSQIADARNERTPCLERARDRSTTPEQLRRALNGDLDKICLRALRKEPARRYGSVEQFSEDIRRHLEGHPVIAQRDTLAYRTRKFLARHRLGVITAATITFTTLTLLIALWVQSGRLRQERDRATRERDRAAQVLQLVNDLFRMTDPEKTRGEAITAMELLDGGAERVAQLKDSQDTAVLLDTLAGLYEDLALYQKAIPLRRRTLRIQEQNHGRKSAEASLALNHLAVLLARKGDFVAAEPYFRECLAIRRQVYADTPYPMVSDSLSNLGLIVQDLGDYTQALAYYQEGMAIERVGQKSDRDRALSFLYGNLALLYLDLGNYERSESLYQELWQLRRKVYGEENQSTVDSLRALAEAQLAAGRYAEAGTHLAEVLAWHRKQSQQPHPGLTRILTKYGQYLCAVDRLEEAQTYLEEAMDLGQKQLGRDHLEYAATMAAMAEYHRREKDHDHAVSLLLQVLDIFKRAGLADHPESVRHLLALSRIYQAQGLCQQATPLLERALTIRRRALPKGNWLIAQVQIAIGSCLANNGRIAEANQMLQGAYRTYLDQLGQDHPQTKKARRDLEAAGVSTSL